MFWFKDWGSIYPGSLRTDWMYRWYQLLLSKLTHVCSISCSQLFRITRHMHYRKYWTNAGSRHEKYSAFCINLSSRPRASKGVLWTYIQSSRLLHQQTWFSLRRIRYSKAGRDLDVQSGHPWHQVIYHWRRWHIQGHGGHGGHVGMQRGGLSLNHVREMCLGFQCW